tara:strand:- start:570 stop:1892 length:1323 start_codon:yes stop_codon:yes gene_type:complete
MSLVVSNPAQTYTVNNQALIYSVYESGSTTGGYRTVIWVYEYDNATVNEIAKVYITPNPSQISYLDLATIVKDRLAVDEAQTSAGTDVIHNETGIAVSTTGTRKYRLDFSYYTTAGGEIAPTISKFIYLVDGAFQVSAGPTPSFADYYATSTTTPYNKVFLTDRFPNAKGGSTFIVDTAIDWKMSDDDEGVVAWIHDSLIIVGVDTKVRIDLYNASGLVGSESLDITALGGNDLADSNTNEKIHYLGVGPKNIVSWASYNPVVNPDWTFYSIKLTAGRNQCSKFLVVTRDCEILRGQRVQLAYTNRLGGWDYLTFDGFNSKSETKTDKPYLKQIGNWGGATLASDYTSFARERVSAQVQSTKNYSLITNRFTDVDFYCLQGALRSNNVMIKFVGGSEFVEDNDKWLPVNIKDSSYEIRDFGNAKIYDVKVKVELAQQIRC